jgi:coenzyme Q-binding protein COQ10
VNLNFGISIMILRMSTGSVAFLSPRPVPRIYGRTFLTAFSQDPITINIRRTLPYTSPTAHILMFRYSASSLYPLIADVDSYSQFLPFCTGSTVTRRDNTNTPTHADLQVGWKGWSETFSSKVSCLKNSAVTVDPFYFQS